MTTQRVSSVVTPLRTIRARWVRHRARARAVNDLLATVDRPSRLDRMDPR